MTKKHRHILHTLKNINTSFINTSFMRNHTNTFIHSHAITWKQEQSPQYTQTVTVSIDEAEGIGNGSDLVRKRSTRGQRRVTHRTHECIPEQTLVLLCQIFFFLILPDDLCSIVWWLLFWFLDSNFTRDFQWVRSTVDPCVHVRVTNWHTHRGISVFTHMTIAYRRRPNIHMCFTHTSNASQQAFVLLCMWQIDTHTRQHTVNTL